MILLFAQCWSHAVHSFEHFGQHTETYSNPITMGFFRRAKARHKPAVDQSYNDDDVVPRRPKSRHSPHHDRDRYHHRDDFDYDEREARIEELPPEPEWRVVDMRDGISIGESLAPEDHFDLYVPLKNKLPRKGILRNRSGQGLMLMPSGRSFSKQCHASDSVSSVSYDSMLFRDNEDVNGEHHQGNLTFSMRSIKSRQSKPSTVRNDNRQDPPADSGTPSRVSPGEDTKQKSMFGCFCWEHSDKRNDIPSRIPPNENPVTAAAMRMTNTVGGIKNPRAGDDSLMNSTIPTYRTEYYVDLQMNDPMPMSESQKSHPLSPSLKKKNDGPLFLNLCGPRRLPSEDVEVDDTTTPYASPAITYRTYEAPLEFEKRDRSLFDTFSSNDDEDAGGRRGMELDVDDEGTIPTYLDESRTTMAVTEMDDIPVHREERNDEYRYDDEDVHRYKHDDEESFDNDEDYDDNNNWRIRLPRKLPKVRNLTRMSSLSRLRGFRSASRSHISGQSGRSGRSRQRRRYGASPSSRESYHDHPNGHRRRRSRSRGRSPGRRALSSPKHKHSSKQRFVPEDYFTNQGKRYHYE